MTTQSDTNVIIAICFAIYGLTTSSYGVFSAIRLIYQLVTLKTKTIKSIRYLTIMAVIIAACGMCVTSSWMVTVYVKPKLYNNMHPIWSIIAILYFLSLTSIITIAAIRIHVTLHSTAYQHSTKVYIIFWTFYILSFIVSILSSIGQIFGAIISLSLGGLAVGIYVLLTFYIIILFIKALKNIADKLDQSKHKIQLFKVMTKYAILVIVPSLVTLITGIGFIAHLFALIFDLTIWVDTIYFTTLTIDFLVNIICITLQFEFNEQRYFKVCRKCHDKVIDSLLHWKDDNDNFTIKTMVSAPVGNEMDLVATSSHKNLAQTSLSDK